MNSRTPAILATLVVAVAACSSSSSESSGSGGTSGASAGHSGAGGSSGSAGGMANGGGAGSGGASGAAGTNGDGIDDGGAGRDVGGIDAGGTGGSDASGASGPDGGDKAGAPGSGGAAGSPSTYNPCPENGDACRVMPLGDSITDGCCGENTISMGASYRLKLFQLSLDNHKNLTFVGSHTSGPTTVNDVAFPQHQEGHPGWTIADGGGRSGLQQQVVGWLNATPPDIVTLMIGTNDVDIQLDLANAPGRLSKLIDTITSTAPKALVVVAQLVPTRNDDENLRDQSFNAAIPALVKSFSDAGKHVTMVDMYDAYTNASNYKTVLLANDLHPSDAGYVVMANTWWDAIGKLLPGD